ncbi:DUF2384 domain-containing protein [Roseomonas sp. E05]|uniref:competence protein CoiA family protein n=1 Tax=Roseomonas sp. E05 TaxID=3046310 RepID=UPI0024BB3B80|nr:antitoxin Xre/MbcA/ParS toxin-binding domain-containing protein [Roseomonas sp. E05]MDJ0388283.1 DUF2384 domain-containing protein [Roseomonas sp. E05]
MDGPASCHPSTPPPPDGDGTKLPYGLAEDGRLAHVSEVASGLGCRCRCPGCGERLVARKGAIKVHHFAHHVDRACVGAWETTLHRLAKEIVLEARDILLPDAVAEVDGLRHDVAFATVFPYEAAEAEVNMGGLRPDAIIRGRGRELLLEFHVRHPCGPEKLVLLRERNLPSVEIDLSRVPRHASRAEHTELVLRGAPRHWLHNAKVVAEEARLRRIAAERAAVEKRRLQRLHGRIADEVAGAWIEPASPGHSSWRIRAIDAGFGGFVGRSVPGAGCFSVAAETWQAAFLDHVAISAAGHLVTGDAALRTLQKRQMLKAPFQIRRNWEPELVAHIQERVPGFRPPHEVIGDYADWLAERGLLMRVRQGWVAAQTVGWEARQRMEAASEARRRQGELQDKLGTLLRAAGLPWTDTASWLDRAVPEFGVAPRVLAEEGGEGFERLMRRLDELERMAQPHASPYEGGLLGLPLEAVLLRRRDEARARQEAARLEREEFARQAAERRRKESGDFVATLVLDAVALMGEDAGTAWVREAVGAATGLPFDEGRFALDWQARNRISEAMAGERGRIMAAREAERRRLDREAEAAAVVAGCRSRLEADVMARFPGQPDWAHMWLRGKHPALGRSPWEQCVDERSLERCRSLLDAARPKGRRR